MRNSTIYGTTDLIDRFMSSLRELGPRNSSNVVTTVTPPSELSAQTGIRWTIAGRSLRFALYVSVSSLASELVRTTTHEQDGWIYVAVAPFISRTQREKLESTGRSYWDPTGNVLLQSRDPLVWVKKDGATKNPSPTTVPTSLRSLKGRSASEVVVRLLANGGATTVRDLSRESGVSLGTVSRVVSLLRHEELLEPNGGGPLVVRDPLRLAQRWTADYSFPKTYKARRYFSILGTGAALSRIKSSGAAYAVTGLAAQALWYQQDARVAPLPSSELWLYTDDVARIERIGDLVPDPTTGTILVAEADFLTGGREGVRPAGDTNTAWPWRVVGDLMSQSGRYAAAGTDFAEELIGRETGPYA